MLFLQKIYFGSPGTGKSYHVLNKVLPRLGVHKDSQNCVTTVFHPDYTYGDFVGKLLPLTTQSGITYEFYPGFFLQALASAYKNILTVDASQLEKLDGDEEASASEALLQESSLDNEPVVDDARFYELTDSDSPPDVDKVDPFWQTSDELLSPPWSHALHKVQHVALVIDEINRGNSSAIFGSIFQLLDRDHEGWSITSINLSDMEYTRLILEVFNTQQNIRRKVQGTSLEFLAQRKIKLPPNLSILATMNTADESIFYMDSAFKRRWEWQFVGIDEELDEVEDEEHIFHNKEEWEKFVKKVNEFIRSQHLSIRGVEDKQIGYWFIPEIPVSKQQVKNKLMFYLWDSVFHRDRDPLQQIVGTPLVAFGDFAQQIDAFLEYFEVEPTPF